MDREFVIIGARNLQGFFSNFFHTLQHLYVCDVEGKIPIVYWKGGIYRTKKLKKVNAWNYFFEPVSDYTIKDIDKKLDNIENKSFYRCNAVYDEPVGCWDYQKLPPNICSNNPTKECRRFVYGLISKHIVIKEDILNRINDFYNNHMKGLKILGVHMRACSDMIPAQGTDPFQRYIDNIDDYISINGSDIKIFVATDYRKYLKDMKKRYGNKIIYTKSVRSKDKKPVQYACKSKRKHTPPGLSVFKEVIIDCILLSKCNMLLHGVSNVSSAVMYFNPELESKFVTEYSKKDRKYLDINDV